MLNPANPEFWVLISFLCFIGVLVYFGVPGLITKALDDRADAIRRELDEAQKLREEAQSLLADYQRKARDAEIEAKAIIEQAELEARALSEETRNALAEMLERRTRLAEAKIARAEAQAEGEVRAAAINRAVAAAEEVLRGRLAQSGSGELIADSIRDLPSRLSASARPGA